MQREGEGGHAPRRCAAALGLALAVLACGGGDARRPDLFLITIDTLRADHLGCYGYARDTSPAIDALARDGVLFENAFTTLPRTMPALASLLTSQHPRRHGVMTNLDALAAQPGTLAERLRDAGYATAAFVTYNVPRSRGFDRGFDVFDDHPVESVDDPRARAERLAAGAAAWLDGAAEPLFLWLHVWDPHFRYQPPGPYDTSFGDGSRELTDLYGRLDRQEIGLGEVFFGAAVTDGQLREAVDLYDGEIRYADAVVGGFLDGLRERGLYDDAVIVFASDHGESLGEHGYFFEHGAYLYDATLRIPLIVRFGRDGPRGLRVKGNVSILDVAPTLLAAAGAAGALPGEGRDLAGFLAGGPAAHPVSFAETGRRYFALNPRRPLPGMAGNWTSIREGDRKLIRIPTPRGPVYELYDLSEDPGELRDRYAPDDPEARRMAADLERWQASFPPLPTPSSADTPLDAVPPDALERLRALGYAD